MLKPSLSVAGWMNFLVVARMNNALGGLKTYQIMLGIVSVMTRINIYFNLID